MQQHAQPVGQERVVSRCQLPREPEASNGTEEDRDHLLAEAARVRRLPRERQGSVEEWEARLEAAFAGEETHPHARARVGTGGVGRGYGLEGDGIGV